MPEVLEDVEVEDVAPVAEVEGANEVVEEAPVTRSMEWRKRKAQDLRGSERRTFSLNDCELREADDGTLHLSGYASVTGVPYEMGWYDEEIRSGGFKKTLGENPDVQLLVNHAGLPLGRTGRNMTLTEDATGLRVEADLDAGDPDVQSLARKMQAGLVDQMSFAFRVIRQEWNEDYSHRTITECDINRGDVSVVNQGASPTTSVSIRSEDALRSMLRLGPEAIRAAFDEYRAAKGEASSDAIEVITNLATLSTTDDEEARAMVVQLTVWGPDEPDADDMETEGRDATDEEIEVRVLPKLDFSAERARLAANLYAPRKAAA